MTRSHDAPRNLSPQEKRKLLAELLQKKANPPQTFPLSFGQQRLWFLDQLEPGSAVYNLLTVVRLRLPLNVLVMEKTLNEIVRRHQILRTTFVTVEGQPVQSIAASLDLSVSITDLSKRPERDRQGDVLRLVVQETRRPFNLAQGPLVRARVVRLSHEEHVVLLVMHHIISDGWSIKVLMRELATIYQAFLAGRPSPLPELPIQYSDYAVWQRDWLQGDGLTSQVSYWKQRLADVSNLELPTDRPRLVGQPYRKALRPLELPKVLLSALNELSRREGCTLFMTLLAAFKALISAQCGQGDIVVGTPVAGRNRPETEGLIGCFVNSLVLRTDLSGDPSFQELMGRVREVCLGAYANQDLPFEKLLEEIRPKRDLSRSPLYQVLFAYQNVTPPSGGTHGAFINRTRYWQPWAGGSRSVTAFRQRRAFDGG